MVCIYLCGYNKQELGEFYIQVNKTISPSVEMKKASSIRTSEPIGADNEIIAQEEVVADEENEDEDEDKPKAKSKQTGTSKGSGSGRGGGARASKPKGKAQKGGRGR